MHTQNNHSDFFFSSSAFAMYSCTKHSSSCLLSSLRPSSECDLELIDSKSLRSLTGERS